MSPVISAKWIKHPQRPWRCSSLLHEQPSAKAGYWRLYGSAEPEDPKYVLKVCDECYQKSQGAQP